MLALGCAGWAAGQLESEILANAWLVGPADPALLFGDDFAGKYDHALALLGARAAHLSAKPGTPRGTPKADNPIRLSSGWLARAHSLGAYSS